MKVKNLNKTSGKECTECGSWLKHWETLADETASFCYGKGCPGSAELGAHVKLVDEGDDSHYIIPLCSKCNKKADAFELEDYAPLVSATPC